MVVPTIKKQLAARFHGTGMARVEPGVCHFVAIGIASPVDRLQIVGSERRSFGGQSRGSLGTVHRLRNVHA
jgi:hypothetical protein